MNALARALAADHAAVTDSDRIQTLRGVACLLLVAFHVIGNSKAGLTLPATSAYREFTEIFLHLRMPLFAFLSGFVYAYRPIQPGGGGLFARKKLYRLLIPLVLVSSAFFIVQQLTPGANGKTPWSHVWEIYVLPYAHFWFLQAIILLFAALALAEHFRLLRTPKQCLWAMLFVLAAHFFLAAPEAFSAAQALYLAPFFLAGVAANRFHSILCSRQLKAVTLVIFLALMTLHVVNCLHGEAAERSTYFGTALSLASIFAAIHWMPHLRFLAWIGGFSFAIYLYHVFFSAGIRIALNTIHVTNTQAHFVLGCAVALMGPILIERVATRHSLTRRALLGQS